eukprot:CAMPEP_0201696962 /NCGR_PEP_ID=MMETSP0578-20130828/8850_1 /ASSEMBLY_ACC=CAM_ASM_000663 /TAXON_ID=267565 /ORGANISM="Skeletonema grethea, Strain CCMP 1804" /LENGTH=112 /DNA_ID=CAMNT_0048183003 /DNA_START=28 /DNA_END=366 /DNA_ORIENTATION=+
MNNHLFTSFTLAVVAIFITTLPSASGLAFLSPLLLRVNPVGIAARMNKSSPSSSVITDSSQITSPSKVSVEETSVSRPSLSSVDFGLDEDMMRYKHELLSVVYEKSLKRGFE